MSGVEGSIDRMLGSNEGSNVIDQEGNTQDTGGEREGGGSNLPATTGQPQQPATRQTPDDQSLAQHDAQGGAAQRAQQQGAPRPADNGDLIDPQTGRVLARAGRDRRVYEQQRAVEKAVGPIQQELATTKAQLQA